MRGLRLRAGRFRVCFYANGSDSGFLALWIMSTHDQNTQVARQVNGMCAIYPTANSPGWPV